MSLRPPSWVIRAQAIRTGEGMAPGLLPNEPGQVAWGGREGREERDKGRHWRDQGWRCTGSGSPGATALVGRSHCPLAHHACSPGAAGPQPPGCRSLYNDSFPPVGGPAAQQARLTPPDWSQPRGEAGRLGGEVCRAWTRKAGFLSEGVWAACLGASGNQSWGLECFW